MLRLALAMALSQGPGSTLQGSQPVQTTRPTSLTVTPAGTGSSLTTRPLESESSLQLRGADALIRKVSLAEGRRFSCETMATQFLCDDPSVMTAGLIDEPLLLTDSSPPIIPHLSFLARQAGRTTCSCGRPKELQLVYDFTVQSLEDALRPLVRKIVGVAYERLYTARADQVP